MLRFNGSPHLTSLLIILNVIVFAAWNIYPPALEFLQLNFLVSWLALEEARYWTTLGSVFSHISFLHIFLNMAALRSFGSAMEIALGPIRFIRFYLVAGIVASFTHAVVSAFILYEPSLPALGASGAVAGIILVFALLFPKEKIMLFGIIPIPAILGAVLLVG